MTDTVGEAGTVSEPETLSDILSLVVIDRVAVKVEELDEVAEAVVVQLNDPDILAKGLPLKVGNALALLLNDELIDAEFVNDTVTLAAQDLETENEAGRVPLADADPLDGQLLEPLPDKDALQDTETVDDTAGETDEL